MPLVAGDIVHIKVGMQMGNGLPPWLPSPTEIADEEKRWKALVPSGVEVVVTHFGIDASAVN